MADQLSDVDLDALERRQTDPNNDPHFDFAMMTKAEALALIRRVRNLEVRNADLRERLFEADRGRDQDAQRNAMLERVVEAARSYADVASHAGAEPWALRAAINAADALRLTENATAPKAGSG